MKHTITRIYLLGVLSLLAGCEANTTPIEDETLLSNSRDHCRVLESRNWTAKLMANDKQPDGFKLTINAEVVLPTPGYSIDWQEGPPDRRHPPGIRIALKTTPPDSIVPQVLTDQTVSYLLDTPFSSFSSVSVYCGNHTLFEVKNIQAGAVIDSDKR